MIPVIDPIGAAGGFPIMLTLPPDDRTADERALSNLLVGHHVLMVTMAEGATLTSRPLRLAEVDHASLRFLVDADAAWIGAVHSGAVVNATVADGKRGRWVSITGRTRLLSDVAMVERLWSADTDRFVPTGITGAAVLELHTEAAAWWESEDTIRRFVHFVKGLVGDEPPDTGRHGLIDLTEHAAVHATSGHA